MKRLAILGAGGHGRVVAEVAEATGWSNIDFFDDTGSDQFRNAHWPVVGGTSSLLEKLHTYSGVFVAIGNNRVREEKLLLLSNYQARLVTLVHPTAVISSYASVGVGTVVMPGVVVNVGAVIGEGVILNTGCSVDHDCVVGNCVHISPGARLAGGVAVGERSWVGIGASVIQQVSIGRDVMVGAGAVVINPVPDSVTVIGVPARVRSAL